MGDITKKLDKELFRRDIFTGEVTGGFFGIIPQQPPDIGDDDEEVAQTSQGHKVNTTSTDEPIAVYMGNAK